MENSTTTSIRKQYVTDEIAFALRELDFDEPSLAIFYPDRVRYSDEGHLFYNHNFKKEFPVLPMWQQVIDWFRDTYRIVINIDYYGFGGNICWQYEIDELLILKKLLFIKGETINESEFTSHAIARECAILAAIKLVNK